MSALCRVCLTGNTTLHSLKNNSLIDVYERLSYTKFNSEDARPRVICPPCYRKLLECHKFSQMTRRSEKIFNHQYDKGLETTHKYKTGVNHLSVCKMQFITIDDNTTNAGSQVTIKNEPEPIPSIEVKEEVTTEDELVDVESVPEDCSRSQFPLGESLENNVEHLPFNSYVGKIKPDISKMIFCCNDCNKIFFLKRKLISHIKKSHSQRKGEQYASIKQHHEKNIIQGQITRNQNYLFACNVCEIQFKRKRNLVRHMRIHTGKKFACNVCEKQFYHKCSLDSHLRTHTEEKPFACNICDKKYNYKCSLDVHLRTHTLEKPFACNICKKKYIRKSYLVSHLQTHTGEKPFACNVCDKQYYSRGSLNYHKYTHTREKPAM